jgi:hypothetical protein
MPGEEEARGELSPLSVGIWNMRRLLNQAANAAVKRKGIFEIVYRRPVPRPGHNKTIGRLRIASVI